MDKVTVNKKIKLSTKRKIHKYVRMAVQLLFFIVMPSIFTTAFSGIKYIFMQIGNNRPVELTSFVMVLIVLCLYTMVFGRFFCGFACAFGALGDFIHEFYMWILKKIKKKPVAINDSINKGLSVIKYFILIIIILLCFTGAYSGIRGWNPWDVFSMIRAGNLKISGYIPALIILLFILVGMAVCERFFCRFLCPMGAVFSILPVLPFFSIWRNREQCIKGCRGCTKVCPAKIELPDLKEDIQPGDCFMCQKCMDVCPKQNIKTELGKGNGIIFIIVRGLILVLIMKWAGI